LVPFGLGPLFDLDGNKQARNQQTGVYRGTSKPPGSAYSRIFVVAQFKEDMDWISRELPEIPTTIYNVEDRSLGEYRVPANKGHEAMVYLTYIIDYYDNLPDIMAFTHANRFAWHNNYLKDNDMAKMLKQLRNERVVREGYIPFRCKLKPGCPLWYRL
jgi:hypothetical protein